MFRAPRLGRPMFHTGWVTTLILAHQGGWDEMLLVVAPVALIGGLLVLANRRARAELSRRAEPAEPTGPATHVGHDGAAPEGPDDHG